MAKKKVVFSFPPRLVSEPITYRLVKDFNLQVNILRAMVSPREQGRMVVEITGDKQRILDALDFLIDRGVMVDALVQELRHYPDLCVNCTACTALCPTEALTVDSTTREVSYDPAECILCESCIPACSYQALESQF